MKNFIKSFFVLNPFSLTFYSVVLVLALFLTGVPFLDLMELRTYDLRFLSRGHQNPSPEIVLAALDEKSLNEIGRWPWPRAEVARLVNTLSQEGAKVIGFDIGFFEPDENSNLKLVNQFHQEIGNLNIKSKRLDEFIHNSREWADNDQILAKAIRDATPAVVLGYFFYMNEEERKAGIGPEERESQLKRINPSKYPIVIYEDENREKSPFIKAYVPESNIEILTRAGGAPVILICCRIETVYCGGFP